MPRPRLAPLDQEHTIIAVIEMSQSSWLVAGVVPGIERQPLKKLAPDQDALLKLSTAGAQRRVRPAGGSRALPVPLKPAPVGFCWRAGSRLLAVWRMSFTPPAPPAPARI